MKARRWICLALVILGSMIAGCESQPPAPTKLEMEEGVKQLNEHRQKEWSPPPKSE